MQGRIIPATIVTSALLLAATGCDNKIEQCNAFIDEANASQNAFVAIGAAALNPESLKKRVEQIDASVKKLEALELKDEKLQGFRTEYVAGLKSFSKGLDKMANLEKTDVDALNKVADDLSKEGDKQGKLVDDVNAYCSGSE